MIIANNVQSYSLSRRNVRTTKLCKSLRKCSFFKRNLMTVPINYEGTKRLGNLLPVRRLISRSRSVLLCGGVVVFAFRRGKSRSCARHCVLREQGLIDSLDDRRNGEGRWNFIIEIANGAGDQD